MAIPVDPARLPLSREELTNLARGLSHSWDAQAGPWRLTEWEWFVQEMCRDHFGFYEPTLFYQARFIDRMKEGVIVSYVEIDLRDTYLAA